MRALFPQAPVHPIAVEQNVPVCEWIMPAHAAWRRDYFSTCKILPPGKPDYLQVNIWRTEQGTERCTSAVYGERAYVVHFEYKAHLQT